MRFLELRADEGIEPLRLHPRLTLVRGLDPAARVAFVGFLHSVATGDTFGWDGTVDVHGVQMSLENALESKCRLGFPFRIVGGYKRGRGIDKFHQLPA